MLLLNSLCKALLIFIFIVSSTANASDLMKSDEHTVNYISYVFGQNHKELFSAEPSKIAYGLRHMLSPGIVTNGLTDIVTKTFMGLNPLNPSNVANPTAFASQLVMLFLLGMPQESSYKEQEIKASHFGKYYFSEDVKNTVDARKKMFNYLEAVSTTNFPYPVTEKKIINKVNEDVLSFIFTHGETEFNAELTLGNVHHSSQQPDRDQLFGYKSYFESQSDTAVTFRVYKVHNFNSRKYETLVDLKEVQSLKEFDPYLKSITSIKGLFIASNDLKMFYHNNKSFTRDELRNASAALVEKQIQEKHM